MVHGMLVKPRTKMVEVVVCRGIRATKVFHATDMNPGAESTDVSTATESTDMATAAEGADVRAATEAAHVATAEATTTVSAASASAAGFRSTRYQARGQQGRCQDCNHSFHVITPLVSSSRRPTASQALPTCSIFER
jgi:hypothetical protein